MPTIYYPAIVERGEAGEYGVFFPDLPGCVSAGGSDQEAAENAEEALALHLEGMIEDGDPLPSPTPLDQVRVDSDIDVVARLLVRGTTSNKVVRINITIDEGLLARIDRTAQRQGLTRSGLLAEGARRVIERSSSPTARRDRRTLKVRSTTTPR